MTGLTRRAVVAGLAVLPFRAWAHGVHGASAWLRSVHRDRDVLYPVVEILNEGGAAVTLRAVTCAAAKAVTFSRRRTVLGLPVEQRVEFLRVDPDELLRLGNDRFRLELAGVATGAGTVDLTLDFGPDGIVVVAIPVPAD